MLLPRQQAKLARGAKDKEHAMSQTLAHLDMSVGGAIEIQTATMDIADYLKQGGQTAGHRELWRLLRTLFKETVDNEELID